MTINSQVKTAESEAQCVLSDRKAQETVVSLARLVEYWDSEAGNFEPHEALWGELLRTQALDLGLGEIYASLPKFARPMALSELDSLLDALRRRGVDLAYVHLLCEQKSEPDLYLSVPRAFPGLNLMSTPDPNRVGLLR